MQFRDLGRLSVINRMEGRGKETRIVDGTFGIGVWKYGCCCLEDMWRRRLKRRTGMGLCERV